MRLARLVEMVHGTPELKDNVIAFVREAGALDKRAAKEGAVLSSSFGGRLVMGLDPSTDAWVA